MSGCPVGGRLGQQLVSARLSAAGSSRIEALRVLPDSRVVVCPVQIQKDPLPGLEAVAVPFQLFACRATDKREEGMIAANFLGKAFQFGVLPWSEDFLPLRVLLQGHLGEDHEPADRDDGPQQIKQFDCRDSRWKGCTEFVGVKRDGRGGGTTALPGRSRVA